MRYKLYLDDCRYPPADDEDWRLARDYHDALWYVRTYGLPYHISFDHDLAFEHYMNEEYSSRGCLVGEIPIITAGPKEFSGYDFAKWFCSYVLDNGLALPDDFGYTVHSANPVGAENIRCYMENFLKDGYVN